MSYTDPLRIGVLACPGGQVFADEIVTFLRKISPGGSNQTAPHVGEKPGDFRIEALFTRFSNGEFKTEILDSVRGMDVFIIQDVSNQYSVPYNNVQEKYVLSINDHIFCLLVTIDAALQAGARRVTVVLPTYPYARQHRKRTREGLTAARFGQIMENMGVERIITLDIHSKEIENTFNHLRLENLHASYQIIRVLKSIIDLRDPNLVIVSPDTGAIDRNKFYSQTLLKPLALLYKERDYSKLSYDAGNSNITNTRLLGPVEGKIVFMGDDMLGTGGTLLHAMKAIQKLGSAKTIGSVSLPFFNGGAIRVFDEAYREGVFYRLIGTNAVYHDETLLDKEWYLSADVSGLFAESIFRLHHNRSVSTLLDNRNIIEDLLKEG